MLQWKKWVCQAFSALLKGLRGEDPVWMASLNIFAFLMLAFQYEESDSASMGGGAVKLGSYQILCVPCWVTVKWLQSLEEFSLHRKPGTEMHTGLGIVDSCEFNYCTSKYFDDVFPKNPVFLKGYTKNLLWLYWLLLYLSVPVWKGQDLGFFSHYTCTDEVPSVNGNAEMFPLTWFSAFCEERANEKTTNPALAFQWLILKLSLSYNWDLRTLLERAAGLWGCHACKWFNCTIL